uniref:Uncharacterized protein n=1 Tax=Utricularia reniformis TaxID=192314 RepID=A0A1Y0B4L8_9LAMI|nr:hypothetical protein AEK19_MT2128 [Utricularia reniformis]ART32279.1 hypothetical protein AEK19_MT2128 [Utricularia reniformis]
MHMNATTLMLSISPSQNRPRRSQSHIHSEGEARKGTSVFTPLLQIPVLYSSSTFPDILNEGA